MKKNLPSDVLLNLSDITKSYGKNTILKDFDLYIKKNEFVTLLGPSGCGKSTTLRLMAGFEKPDSGNIYFEGKDITNLNPEKREINTVFQNYSLFDHMTVGENIAFGLKIKKKSKEYIKEKIDYALKLVNLEGFEDRYPKTLSGGQKQRIAIARAIVNEPEILLLDEPLGALDLKLRQSMQLELMRLKNELGITFVYVTHDQEEALTMSDTVVVMNHGVIQQIGTPEDIYNEPKNAYVAKFIGDVNLMDGSVISKSSVKIFDHVFECTDEGFYPGDKVDVMIRPEDIILVQPDSTKVTGIVDKIIFKGVHYQMRVNFESHSFLVCSTLPTPVGSKVGLKIDPFNIRLMKKEDNNI